MSAVGAGAWPTPIGNGVRSVTQQRLPAITSNSHQMRRTDQPSLPQWIQNAYESLETAYASDTDELSREAVTEILLTETKQIETDADATYALNRLLERGWLYEVDGQLRKTD